MKGSTCCSNRCFSRIPPTCVPARRAHCSKVSDPYWEKQTLNALKTLSSMLSLRSPCFGLFGFCLKTEYGTTERRSMTMVADDLCLNQVLWSVKVSMGVAVLSHFVFTQCWAKMNFSKPGTATVHKLIHKTSDGMDMHGRIVFSCGCESFQTSWFRQKTRSLSSHWQWACPDVLGHGRHLSRCVLTCRVCVFTLRFSMTFAARVEGAKGKVCGTFLSCATQVLSPWNFPEEQDRNYKKVWNFKMLLCWTFFLA